MVKGLLSDANIEGHVARLVLLMHEGYRGEFWHHLGLRLMTFHELGLAGMTRTRIWQVCQERELVLITANRNEEGPDSLQATIRLRNQVDCLPVITLADPERFLNDRSYAERAADTLLGYLFALDLHLGVGRLFIP